MTVVEGRFLNVDYIYRLYRRNAEFRTEFQSVVTMSAANRLGRCYDYFGHSPESVYFHNVSMNCNIRRIVNTLKDMNTKYVNDEGQKELFKGFISGIDSPHTRMEICDELFDIALYIGNFGATISEDVKIS